jgi:glucose-6-phosphate isomerase, archaeal
LEFNVDKIKPYDMPMRLQLDLATGELAPFADTYERHLSQLAGLFSDQQALQQILQEGDPLLYDVRTRPFVTSLSDFTFAVTRVYPGKVGQEYYMTKGHHHQLLDQPEIYFCLQGQGCLLLESGEGDFQVHWWTPGTLSHIPPGYAHRTVNTCDAPLVFASFYHLSAGHDYDSIARRGFAQIVVERSGRPTLIPNPLR